MRSINGPVIACVSLNEGAVQAVSIAATRARDAQVPHVVCHVLPEVYRITSFQPTLHEGQEVDFLELEEAVRKKLEELVRDGTAGSSRIFSLLGELERVRLIRPDFVRYRRENSDFSAVDQYTGLPGASLGKARTL